MAQKAKRAKVTLDRGQIWRTEKGYIEIVQLGKTLAHYRRSAMPRQKGLPVFLTSMTAMTEMLERGQAELMETAS